MATTFFAIGDNSGFKVAQVDNFPAAPLGALVGAVFGFGVDSDSKWKVTVDSGATWVEVLTTAADEWARAAGVTYVNVATDQILVGSVAVADAAAGFSATFFKNADGEKGISNKNLAADDVVFTAQLVADNATPANGIIIISAGKAGFQVGAGGAPPDVGYGRDAANTALITASVRTRTTSPIIDRADGTLTMQTTRATNGAGDATTVKGGNGLSGAGAAVVGGPANLTGGNANAVGPGNFAAKGGDANVTAGTSAFTGTGVATGADVVLTATAAVSGGAAALGGGIKLLGAAGAGGGNGGDVGVSPGPLNGGGVDGAVVFQINGAARTPNLVPRVDNEGNIGIAGRRWALVRATTVTSGAILEEEVFAEEGLSLADKLDALARDLAQQTINGIENVRHLPRIAMVAAHTIRDLAARLAGLDTRLATLEGSLT